MEPVDRMLSFMELLCIDRTRLGRLLCVLRRALLLPHGNRRKLLAMVGSDGTGR